MINGDERLIIVLGMAHSGTTILTYVLNQHPGVSCCINGNEHAIMENDYLLVEDTVSIQALLNNEPQNRILLKRPWTEVWHAEWLKREMPNARYVYCYRNFEDISTSWSKPGSMVSSDLRDSGLEHQREFYDYCWKQAVDFSESVPYFYWHYHPTFIMENPLKVVSILGNWLGLSRWYYDTSMVNKCINIKDIILRENNKVYHL